MQPNQTEVSYKIIQTDWKTAKTDIKAVRERVFIVEQGIPCELEWEPNDHDCIHLIAYSTQGEPIGTGRILANGLIGRMAVLPSWRSKGVGTALLKTLIEIAKHQHLPDPCLHAQNHAIAFYRRFGFAEQGALFYQGGIPHRLMRLK